MSHTVLVVEDDEDLRELMRDALEQNGYAVVAVGNGQEALDIIGSIEMICVVILDLLMPVMDGWEFFRRFRERAELTAIPVVVHTSAPGVAPEGASRVVLKPVEFDRLLSIVRDYCPR